jgi:DNA polymerase I-like protein with 3'-5' exonuclease and polymerase domains
VKILTGVYCFDTNIRNIRKKGIKICGQFHDEIIFPLRKGEEETKRADLLEAINETNAELKLNIELGISIDFGYTYADIH